MAVCIVGTYIYAPPEMFIDGMYQAEPLTVWQLGVVMFGMLHRRLPFRGSIEIAYGEPDIGDGLSVGKSYTQENTNQVQNAHRAQCLY